MGVKRTETMWGTFCGGLAAYKAGPIQRELANSIRLFRKPWLRYAGQFAAFSFFYYVGTQMPTRFFRLASKGNVGATHDVAVAQADLVSRFRLFDEDEHDGSHRSQEDQYADYLATYSSDPLDKPELLNQMMKNIRKNADLKKVFRVKRRGADLDPWHWSFGKIHGLENIAFCDPAELEATNGNPVKL